MKKTLLVFAVITGSIFSSTAQQQIGNGSLEDWENLGTATVEPMNWNSFKTGTGDVASLFGSTTLARSTDTRPGTTGSYSARIWSKSTLGIVANGNLTLGQIHMGSSTPSSSSNYNFSKISDSNFSETLTDTPDSIVFWVKFNAASGSSLARMHAIIHDAYELRDPIDAGSSPYVVATAVLNYPPTNSGWIRKSVPFNYVVQGPSVNAQFILLTFSTNQTPGGGSAGDEVFIDDVQLIYNPTGGGDDNLPIVANDANVQTPFNTPIVIDMNNHVTDPENDIDFSTLSVTSTPLGGTALENTSLGTVTYTPNNGFWGDDQFNYSVCDGGEPQTCDNGTIFVTIDEELGLTSTVLDQVLILVKNQTLRIMGADENVLVELMDVRGSIIAKGNATTIFDIEQHKGILLVRLTSSLKHRVVRIANL